MKIIKQIITVIFLFFIFIIVAIFALFAVVAYRSTHYYNVAAPSEKIEETYTRLGSYKVSYKAFDAKNEIYKKYEIWYPSELENNQETIYPVVVMANGTGTKASQYKEVFRHLASWGFIVIGNEDEHSRTGASSAATLDFILTQNNDKNSIFFNKIDTNNIGIAGHSQGGVGAINAVTAQPNGTMYQAMFTASATSSYWEQDTVFGAEWHYDISKVKIPCFMVAGTGYFDAGTAEDITATEGQGICPLWSMTENYNAIPDSVPKVMARATGKDHGDMLKYSDGYMTAWFLYWLKGDTNAGGAFLGSSAELLTNPQYQDQRTNLSQK